MWVTLTETRPLPAGIGLSQFESGRGANFMFNLKLDAMSKLNLALVGLSFQTTLIISKGDDHSDVCNQVAGIIEAGSAMVLLLRPDYRQFQDEIIDEFGEDIERRIGSDYEVIYGDAFRIDTWNNRIDEYRKTKEVIFLFGESVVEAYQNHGVDGVNEYDDTHYLTYNEDEQKIDIQEVHQIVNSVNGQSDYIALVKGVDISPQEFKRLKELLSL